MILYSGLPRSGTNLLKNILSQNQALKVSHESALCNMVHSLLQTSLSYKNEYYLDDINDLEFLFENFIKGGIEKIDQKHNKIHINHNKGWTNYIPSMIQLGYKTIFSVRNITDILFSFEKQNKKHLTSENLYNLNCNNPYIGMLEKHEHISFFQSGISFLNDVSINLNKYKDKLLIIKYEDFIRYPKQILNKIYNFVGADYYDHDLNNIPTNIYNDMHVKNRPGVSHEVRSSLDNYLPKNDTSPEVNKYFNDKYKSITNMLGYI